MSKTFRRDKSFRDNNSHSTRNPRNNVARGMILSGTSRGGYMRDRRERRINDKGYQEDLMSEDNISSNDDLSCESVE